MVDTPTTPDMKQMKVDTDAAKDSLTAFNGVVTNSMDTLNSFKNFISNSAQSLGGLGETLKKLHKDQQNSVYLTQQQSDLFGVLGAAALGASKAFDTFGNQKGLMSFGDQISGLIQSARQAAIPLTAITQLANSFGIKIPSGIAGSFDLIAAAVKKVGTNFLESADSALKLQNGFLQMSAQGGSFGRVFEQSGEDLNNLNNLLQKQAVMIGEAAIATNTGTHAVTEYYSQLGKLPGFLTAQIDASDKAGVKTNTLTAAIKIAQGTGQNYEDVLNDLSTAYEKYGDSAQKAYEFTANIAGLSQRYTINLADTRNFVDSMANSFKFLGENADASTGIFNRFFSGLRDSGLSVKSTVEVLNSMTDSLSRMSVAQKAFLSARTGGPGGLLGAVQIEKELREGNSDAVMKRLETALKQQFGRIVTQQEGATNERSAAEFVRQRMFLTQGPFGNIVGGEGQATRLLEALAKPGGYQKEDAAKLLKKDIDRGTAVSETSNTQLAQANLTLEAQKMLMGVVAANTTQIAFGNKTGNTQLKAALHGGITDAMKAGREVAHQAGKTQQDDMSAQYFTKLYKSTDNIISTFGLSISSAGHEINNVIGGHKMTADEQQAQYERAKEQVNRSSTVGRAADSSIAVTQQMNAHLEEIKNKTADKANMHKGAPTKESITVNIVGVCPDCHKKFVTNSQMQQASTNNAPGQFGPGF